MQLSRNKHNTSIYDGYTLGEIARSLIRLAYFCLYRDIGWTTEVKSPSFGTSKRGIAAFKLVKYGVFQPTPFPILKKILTTEDIGETTRLFDFGSGDGFAARIFATTGCSVQAIEENKEIFELSDKVSEYFQEAMQLLLNQYSLSLATQRAALLELNNIDNRITFSCKDIFKCSSEISSVDFIYLYYPEPSDAHEGKLFSDLFDRFIANSSNFIDNKTKVLIVRQGPANQDMLNFQTLVQKKAPKEIRSGTASISSLSSNQFKGHAVTSVATVTTIYQYALKLAYQR